MSIVVESGASPFVGISLLESCIVVLSMLILRLAVMVVVLLVASLWLVRTLVCTILVVMFVYYGVILSIVRRARAG